MEINNFDKENKECIHEWNFLINSMKNNNIFIEKCLKCSKTITTHELFEE